MHNMASISIFILTASVDTDASEKIITTGISTNGSKAYDACGRIRRFDALRPAGSLGGRTGERDVRQKPFAEAVRSSLLIAYRQQ